MGSRARPLLPTRLTGPTWFVTRLDDYDIYYIISRFTVDLLVRLIEFSTEDQEQANVAWHS